MPKLQILVLAAAYLGSRCGLAAGAGEAMLGQELLSHGERVWPHRSHGSDDGFSLLDEVSKQHPHLKGPTKVAQEQEQHAAKEKEHGAKVKPERMAMEQHHSPQSPQTGKRKHSPQRHGSPKVKHEKHSPKHLPQASAEQLSRHDSRGSGSSRSTQHHLFKLDPNDPFEAIWAHPLHQRPPIKRRWSNLHYSN